MSFSLPALALVLSLGAAAGEPPPSLRAAEAETGLAARLPAWLPPGYALESAEALTRGKRKILHLRFTDGEGALSLFECPPRTRLSLGGRTARSFRLAGGRGRLAETEQGPALAWSRGGARLVLVGRLAPDELRRVADSIP